MFREHEVEVKEELDEQIESVGSKAGEEGGGRPHLDIGSWPAGRSENCLKIPVGGLEGAGFQGVGVVEGSLKLLLGLDEGE